MTSAAQVLGWYMLREFCLKISANDVLITARKPHCVSAHGAGHQVTALYEIVPAGV